MSVDTKRDSAGFLGKKPDKLEKRESGSKSLRIDLELFEPDEHNSPEFNYKKLMHLEKVCLGSKKKKKFC